LSFYLAITLLLAITYVLLICHILSSWDQHPEYNSSELDPTLGLSILIPARNEAENILSCLNSILNSAGDIPNPIELIVIDDHSEDKTSCLAASIEDDRIKIIGLADHLPAEKYNSYKKLALGLGLCKASHDYILQVDADVVVPQNYVSTILSVLSTEQPDLIAGPVLLTGNSRFQKFQTLDLMGMMAVTATGIRSGKWHIANGANLCYRKNLVNFQESDQASGDDVGTIQALAAQGCKILFLKSLAATVSTAAVPTTVDFYKQRIRWATKNKSQSSFEMKLMMAIPFLNCILLLLHLPLLFVYGSAAVVLFCFHLLVKVSVDYVYLRELAQYFRQESVMTAYGYSSVLHPIYIAAVGVASLLVKKYEWKGRRVS